jgi:hypothetical protein
MSSAEAEVSACGNMLRRSRPVSALLFFGLEFMSSFRMAKQGNGIFVALFMTSRLI